MRGGRPAIGCDADEGSCGAWDLDYYAENVSAVNGVPITSTNRAPGWTVTADGDDLCPEHAAVPEAGEREAMLTAQEWCEALGWHILDPDGWRDDGTPWLTLITRADFERRAAMSTARGPGYWSPAVPVGVRASSYFDTLRSMTDDPEVLAAADRVEAEVGVQPEPAEERCEHTSWCEHAIPAVPVVHPEPAKLAEKWMRDVLMPRQPHRSRCGCIEDGDEDPRCSLYRYQRAQDITTALLLALAPILDSIGEPS